VQRPRKRDADFDHVGSEAYQLSHAARQALDLGHVLHEHLDVRDDAALAGVDDLGIVAFRAEDLPGNDAHLARAAVS